MNLRALKAIHQEGLDYCRHIEGGAWLQNDKDLSAFWKALFDNRENYPGLNDMLLMRRGGTKWVDPDLSESTARTSYSVVARSMPKPLLDSVEESALGSPCAYQFGPNALSAGAIVDALTTFRIIQACKFANLDKSPLRVLEIGAGYGGAASQLRKHLNIRSYCICDLPKNLFLSSFYIRGNDSNANALYVREGETLSNLDAQVLFVVPPFLKNLQGEFDLILNTYSFQEMNLESVLEYFDYARNHLAPNGIFYSLNSHGKTNVGRPSDYPLRGFKVLSFRTVRDTPFQLFATEPYEVILQLGRYEDGVTRSRWFDVLGFLVQLGLQQELQEWSEDFSRERMSPERADFFDHLYLFFNASPTEKLGMISNTGASVLDKSVIAYLTGSVCFVLKQYGSAHEQLRTSLDGLQDSLASIRARILLAAIHQHDRQLNQRDEILGALSKRVPHLMQEIESYLKHPNWLRNETAVLLRMEPERPGRFQTAIDETYGKFSRIRSKFRRRASGYVTENS
jgi:putative sugar O-methyltransferase